MSGPSLPVQRALYQHLISLGSEIEGRVYDEVPPDDGRVSFPYASFGTAQAVPMDETCTGGVEVYLDLDVWARGGGKASVKRIADVLHSALDDHELAIDGFVCDRMQVRDIVVTTDPDGRTARARISLQIDVQPNP